MSARASERRHGERRRASHKELLAWVALLCAACPNTNTKYPKPEPAPSDAPWVLFLKEHNLAPRPAPGWEKAILAYQLKQGCPLQYSVNLSVEARNTTARKTTALPKKSDSLAMFQIDATQDGAIFSSSESSIPFESAPGVLLDHFWVDQIEVPLATSPQQLRSTDAPRAPWIDLINAPGASLFFPIVTGERTSLGQRWQGLLEVNANPQPEPSPWMPWKEGGQTEFLLDGLYTLHGERLAVITARWTKHGAWSQDATSPFYQATESGLATYIWLADRGWPLLSEVFVTVSLDTSSLDTPASFYSYTLVGRSSLTQSCEGLTLTGD